MENEKWPFPTGMRFCPTDKELLHDYLRNKIKNLPLPCDFLIKNVRLYDYTPDQLAARYDDRGRKEWFFFTVREKKYEGGGLPNRVVATGDGIWKTTSGVVAVRDGGVVIGFKRSLVFYQGKKKTNWLMNEYFLQNSKTGDAGKESRMYLDLALCRIHNKYFIRGDDLPAPLSHRGPAPAPPLRNSDGVAESLISVPSASTQSLEDSVFLSDDNLQSYFFESPAYAPPLQNLDFSSGTILESCFDESPAFTLPAAHNSMSPSSTIQDSECPQSAALVSPHAQPIMFSGGAIPGSPFPESLASVLPAAHPNMYCSDAIPKGECPQSPASVLSAAHSSIYCSDASPKIECPHSPETVLPAAHPSMYCSDATPKRKCPQSPASMPPAQPSK